MPEDLNPNPEAVVDDSAIFEAMADLEIDSDLPPEGTSDEPPATSETPPVTPAPEPATTPAPVAAEPATPQAPAAPAGEPPAPAPASTPPTEASPVTPELTREQVLAQRASVIEEISSRYSFSEEEAEALREEPEKILPKMVGKLYADVFDGVYAAVAQALPTLVHTINQQASMVQKSEQQFYERWPALRTADRNRVVQIVKAFRQANPTAPLDRVIEDAGASAHIALGIPVPSAAPNASAPQTPSRPPMPAMPGASAAPMPGNRQLSIWEEIASQED